MNFNLSCKSVYPVLYDTKEHYSMHFSGYFSQEKGNRKRSS